jgi:Kef-type K+ transport system membrane component KefB/Trk K+ transport system NAD-binding subunit
MEEHSGTGFLPLLLVLLLAFLVPLMLSRFKRVPVVVGEIVAGVIIGHSGLNLVGSNPTLVVMSDIGLAFLMFLAGMEIDFAKLFPPREKGKPRPEPNLPGMAFIVYLITLGLAIPGGFLLTQLGLEGDPFLLAFVLSATSLGVLLPVLKERGLLQQPSGQLVFLTALLADFVTVLLLTVYIITLDRGLDPEIFSLGLLFVAFFAAYRFGLGITRIPGVRNLVEELSQATVQLKVRGAIAILMGFVVLAELLGAELILGAFLAGMVISLIRAPQDDDLVHKLEAFGFGFFIPVFFIMAGVELDLGALFESPTSLALLPILFIVALIVKVGPALLFRRVLSWRETFAGALLLNTHLSLEIAVAVIGLRLGLLSPATNAAVIVFAILTVFLMPVLFNALQPPTVEEEEKFILIFGAKGDFSYQVAQELVDHGETVKFIEPDTTLRERTQNRGFEVIPSEVTEESIYEIGPPKIRNFLVLGTTDERNLSVSKAAVCAGVETITAMVNQPAEVPQFQEIGVQPFSPGMYRSALLSMLVRNPDMFNLLTSTTDQQNIREFQLCNPALDGKRVRHLQLSGELLIVSISREGELLIPHGNMRVHLGDQMTILGSLEALDDARVSLGA